MNAHQRRKLRRAMLPALLAEGRTALAAGQPRPSYWRRTRRRVRAKRWLAPRHHR